MSDGSEKAEVLRETSDQEAGEDDFPSAWGRRCREAASLPAVLIVPRV